MLHFYHGDPYDIEQAVLLKHPQPIRLDNPEVSIKEAIAQALTTNLLHLDEGKLIWLREVKYLALEMPARDLQVIATAPSNHLVITGTLDERTGAINAPDRRLKWVKDAIKLGALVQEFKALTSWDTQGLQQRVLAFAARAEVNLDSAEVNLLAEIAPNGYQLEGILQQIALYVEQAGGMDTEAIAQLTHPSGNPFEFAKVLLRGQPGLAELHELENSAQPPHPMEVFAILGTQLRTWLIVLSMKGQDRGAIAQTAGINPQRIYYLHQELGVNTRNPVTIEQLHHLIAALVGAQVRYLKGEPDALTEMLLDLATQYN